MNRWKIILRYGLVFILGVALGMTGSRLAHKHRLAKVMQNRPAAQRRMMMRRLTAELQLTAPQQAEIERIVNAQIEALSGLRERYRPEVQAILQQAENEMKPHLLPAQQQKLDQVMKELQKRRSKHAGPPARP